MNKKNANLFDLTEEQIIGIYEEVLLLSKKKPDGPINKFKLKFINELLAKANSLLGDNYLPLSEFRSFDEEMLPSTSDVVFILSQYLKVMDKYRYDKTKLELGSWYWILEGGEELETKRPKFN